MLYYIKIIIRLDQNLFKFQRLINIDLDMVFVQIYCKTVLDIFRIRALI